MWRGRVRQRTVERCLDVAGLDVSLLQQGARLLLLGIEAALLVSLYLVRHKTAVRELDESRLIPGAAERGGPRDRAAPQSAHSGHVRTGV
jgi:hypothetical protein